MPSADLVFTGAAIKATQFPGKHGILKPRLTISRRMNLYSTSEITLTIELSLPKLSFGNNAAEFCDTKILMLLHTDYTKC